MQTYGLYLHIPFCKSRCAYCDFVSCVGDAAQQSRYLDAVEREAALRADPSRVVDTMYWGGGTPSVLSEPRIVALADAIGRHFALRLREFTVETNPSDVRASLLDAYRRIGVTRISLGVQSLDDTILREIGRRHTADQACEAIRMCVARGFDVSADLMLGLPGQTFADIERFVDTARRLGVGHVSAYQLKLESGTPLAERVRAGATQVPDDDACADLYESASRRLEASGYACYEISNFAQAGKESLHNLKYWRCDPYIGIGAAAHGLIDDVRWCNPDDIWTYVDALERGDDPRRVEQTLSKEDRMQERVMLGLRTAQGVDLERFRRDFDCDFRTRYAAALDKMRRYLVADEARVAIRAPYRNVMNAIVLEFL